MDPTEEYTSVYDYYYDNDTLCDYSEWEPSFSLIPVLYMLIFILGLSGNGVVIFTVWRSQSKRRAADVYIGNLALADLTFVITLPLWAVYTALGYHWPFGVALCKISSYVVLVNMYASVFCLTCLSFDRYLAIVHSLSSSRLRSRGTMLASLGAIWLLSFLLAVPTLLFRTTVNDDKSNRTTCAMDFSLVTVNEIHENLWIAGLSLSSSALGFLLPFLAMTIFYCFIGCTVTRHFNNLRKEDQKKRRLLKIITTLVVVFAICWTPFHMLKSIDALSYLNLASSSCEFERFLLVAHPYATCLAYVNSCLNPFLYAFFDLRFRSQCLCLLNLKKAMHGQISSMSSTLSAQTQKSEVQSLATKV
ncbi:apelin receptor A [Esox lucius]|uniref:G-protein coupled receptors family 1 profile domain-containing protein n=1 Tax=Esox lucius TaxID=8010 RepID=A0AAY5KRS2_ESOLU|nr:apelin receptor A [Esox lucius]